MLLRFQKTATQRRLRSKIEAKFCSLVDPRPAKKREGIDKMSERIIHIRPSISGIHLTGSCSAIRKIKD